MRRGMMSVGPVPHELSVRQGTSARCGRASSRCRPPAGP